MDAQENAIACGDGDAQDSAPDELGGGVQGEEKLFDLTRHVSFWSDYLAARLHPKSNILLNEYQHKNTLRPFDIFGLGETAFKEDSSEDVEESVRFFAEECDKLQAFQMLNDNFDAFGGLSASLVDMLADEYPQKTLLSFPTAPCSYEDLSVSACTTRLLNSALSFSHQLQNVSAISPLSLASDTYTLPGRHRVFEYISYDPLSSYHTSAVIATAFDTISLPFRTRSRPEAVVDLVSLLTPRDRKLVATSVLMPFPVSPNEPLTHRFKRNLGAFTSLTPACQESENWSSHLVQSMCLRGVNNQMKTKNPSQKENDNPFTQCDTVEEALMLHLHLNHGAKVRHIKVVNTPSPVCRPFPSLWDKRLDQNGLVSSSLPTEDAPTSLTSVPVMSSWHNSTTAAAHAESLHSRAKRVKLNKMHRFVEAGLEQDDLVEGLERIACLAENYYDTEVI